MVLIPQAIIYNIADPPGNMDKGSAGAGLRELLLLLVEAGVQLNVADYRGHTALHIATTKPHRCGGNPCGPCGCGGQVLVGGRKGDVGQTRGGVSSGVFPGGGCVIWREAGGMPTNQLTNQLTSQPTNQLTYQPANQLTNQLTNPPVYQADTSLPGPCSFLCLPPFHAGPPLACLPACLLQWRAGTSLR